jgi:lysophospholipase L1-like esterase
MGSISRIDRIIGVALLALLLALLGWGMAQRSTPGHVVTAVAITPQATLAAGSSDTSPAVSRPTGVPPTGSTGTTGSTGSGGSTTTTVSAASTAPTGPVPLAGPVTAVGDSIMLDIQPNLAQDMPGVQIDGLVSRQFETGIGVVQADRAAGTLGNVLVVELGTNGSVTPSDFDAMMQAATGVKRVVFVNIDVPRSWEVPDNAALAAGVARYPGVAVLADWNALSSSHPEWFTPDQVHLEPTGAQALAGLIAQYA